MISPKKLYKNLKNNGIKRFIGVPDSVLKNFLQVIPKKENFISNNEGSAISFGAGYHLSTSKLPLIYLQNSGLGNAINPLISITHKKVYSIPLILLVGWRGSPDQKDEPQHLVQGKVTKSFLKLLGIKFLILNNDKDLDKIKKLINFSKNNNSPVAILVKNGKFEKIDGIEKSKKNQSNIKRINFLESLLKKIGKNYKLVSTTGYTSRELYQLRKEGKYSGSDFYMVGGMGHVSNVALGYSKFSKKKIIVLDGDGSLLMHLGSMVNCGVLAGKNFKYILLNNSSHESVGGQKTLIDKIDLKYLSMALGFQNYIELKSKKDLEKKLNYFLKSSNKVFMNVKIMEGSIKNLSRPKNFLKIKKTFMRQ